MMGIHCWALQPHHHHWGLGTLTGAHASALGGMGGSHPRAQGTHTHCYTTMRAVWASGDHDQPTTSGTQGLKQDKAGNEITRWQMLI